MRELNVTKLLVPVVDLWMNQWLLLTAGTMADCNMMTVAWGSLGCMWGKPFAQALVRPQRHTRRYMDEGDSFTLCAFPESFRNDLQTLGTVSGKTGPKLKKTSITLRPSSKVPAPSYEQAGLILECRKIYQQDMDPAGFMDDAIEKNYKAGDYHRIYFGEIVAAFSNDKTDA